MRENKMIYVTNDPNYDSESEKQNADVLNICLLFELTIYCHYIVAYTASFFYEDKTFAW
jgi:hypothetical protein